MLTPLQRGINWAKAQSIIDSHIVQGKHLTYDQFYKLMGDGSKAMPPFEANQALDDLAVWDHKFTRTETPGIVRIRSTAVVGKGLLPGKGYPAIMRAIKYSIDEGHEPDFARWQLCRLGLLETVWLGQHEPLEQVEWLGMKRTLETLGFEVTYDEYVKDAQSYRSRGGGGQPWVYVRVTKSFGVAPFMARVPGKLVTYDRDDPLWKELRDHVERQPSVSPRAVSILGEVLKGDHSQVRRTVLDQFPKVEEAILKGRFQASSLGYVGYGDTDDDAIRALRKALQEAALERLRGESGEAVRRLERAEAVYASQLPTGTGDATASQMPG